MKREISNSELILLNSQGFIPGPSETEEDFVKRIALVKEESRKDDQIPRAHWNWVRLHLKEIFDFEPHCLPAFYSNRSLAPWQGAASWIENGRLASLQLREGLRKGSCWGYSRSEILAHEAVHAARSAFEEPEFEEFFAYMVSEKWWRRVLGPIVKRPFEAWLLLIGLAVGIFIPLANLGAALWIGAGFLRLMRVHKKVRRAGKNILDQVKNPKKARAILVRLTDAEIGRFAKEKDLFAFAKKQQCLRWRLIQITYL